MMLMIKLEKPDIKTIQRGNNLAIKTDLLEIVFSPEAAVEFAGDVRQILKRRQRAEASGASTPPPREHKCEKCGKDIGGSLWGFCSPECLAALVAEDQRQCSPLS